MIEAGGLTCALMIEAEAEGLLITSNLEFRRHHMVMYSFMIKYHMVMLFIQFNAHDKKKSKARIGN